MAQEQEIVPLRGGLDLVTPAMMVKPGFCIAAQNYEVEARGYRRVAGTERLDGRQKPSEAEHYILDFDSATAPFVEDEIVTGLASGAAGVALIDGVMDPADVEVLTFETGVYEAGVYEDGDITSGHLVLYNVTGSFQNDEALQVGGVTRALANGTALEGAGATAALRAAYNLAAAEKRRAMIAAPAGSGPVRGVATYKGDIYCWRDNADATAGQMFKATPAGWELVSFGHHIAFDAGTTAFAPGETLTGGTSGATGTIERVVRNDGAWDGDASGYLVLSGVTGTFQDDETVTSASGSATANGAAVASGLPPGGKYRSIVTNFFATQAFERLYFVNGVGYAHEFDGTVMAPIITKMPTDLDKPEHIAEHRLHLFLAFRGGSLQWAATGQPLVFDAVQGAGEHGFGEDITGLKSNAKDSLVVTGRNRIGYLVGARPADFDLRPVSGDSGAFTDTLEIVGSPMFLDNQGVRDMQAAQSFGDWRIGTQTQLVEPLLRAKREAGIAPTGALRVRAKDQYRLYYEDGTGIVIYFGRKDPEVMPITLGFLPFALHSGEDANGYEVLLAAGADGMVYEIDSGTSHDGAPISAFLRPSHLNQRMPNREKRYHRARLEGQAGRSNTTLFASADFSYGNPDQPSGVESGIMLRGAGGAWDEVNWDEFNWDAPSEGQAFLPLDGIGENVSIVLMSDSATEDPHSLSTLTINYSVRRKLR